MYPISIPLSSIYIQINLLLTQDDPLTLTSSLLLHSEIPVALPIVKDLLLCMLEYDTFYRVTQQYHHMFIANPDNTTHNSTND
jgi:hypothetical protein